MSSYEKTLSEKIQLLIQNSIVDFHEILQKCEGADPRKVHELINSLDSNHLEKSLQEIQPNYELIGNKYLPAPDVSYSQWWFEEATINSINEKIHSIIRFSKEKEILCIGTPTLSLKASNHYNTTLLDIDSDVINVFNNLGRKNCKGIEYNFANDLEDNLKGKFDIALIDPPWYDLAIKYAINRAIQGVKIGKEIIMSFPGKLTRPGIDYFRSELIKEIVSLDHDIVSIEHDILSYTVPFFELNALKDIEGFKSISWRKGDLIVFKKNSEKLLDIQEKFPIEKVNSFSRNPLEFRVFLKENNSLSEGIPPQKLIDYSKNISTRNYADNPDLWTTTKVGLQISDYGLIKNILSRWQEGKSQKEISELLEFEKEYSKDKIQLSLKILDNECKLWSAFSSPDVLKSPEEIIESQKKSLSKFAIFDNNRITKEISDGFRPPFSRDRDRLIWSSGLKRLADKTQLFPSTEDDSVRRRLTHTLEVQQLALTIGTSLGLNLDLIEACALAHDIGHTPFGHAGEYAIHKLLNQIHKNLNGFNHYEHGLDVLSFIESPYANDPLKKFLGLNISIEVLEGVIKHTYYHSNQEFSSIELIKRSKHKEYIPPGYCHLEGQSVRIADKISYLISDIEDGLRLGAIDIFDLRKCQLFHMSPLFFNSNSSEPVLQQYLRQRKSIIKILMEDVISSSTLRISQKDIRSPQDARDADNYVINHSEEIFLAVGEIWKNLQAGKLFSNRKVLNSNLLAAKIVSELVILFAIIPDLIETDFRKEYISIETSKYYSFYKDKLGEQITIKAEMLNYIPFHLLIGTQYPAYQDIDNVPLIDLIRSKDYVASLSDYKARKLHNQLLTNEMK